MRRCFLFLLVLRWFGSPEVFVRLVLVLGRFGSLWGWVG